MDVLGMTIYALGVALGILSWTIALNTRRLSEWTTMRLPARIRRSMPRRDEEVEFLFLRVPFHVVLDLPLYALSTFLAFGGVAVYLIARFTWYELAVYGYGFKAISLGIWAIAMITIWPAFRPAFRFPRLPKRLPWAPSRDTPPSEDAPCHPLQRAPEGALDGADNRARR